MPAKPAQRTPRISVVIPVLNEARHITECVRSVQAQTYPDGRIEIVLADGGSTDGTQRIVNDLAQEDPRIRLLDNPGRTQASGLNIAIAATRGDIVARLDGHAAWPPGHLARCVELLEETGADNVGGTMVGKGETPVGHAVARATRSPFAVGRATYRYSNRQQEVETVWLGCFRRSALERVGQYDETATPHEDYELNQRIRDSGGLVIFSPDLPTVYWGRGSWRAVATQYFKYGRAKVRVARRRPKVIRLYHLAPPALVLGTLVAAVVAARPGAGRRLVLAGAAAYTAACVGAAAAAAGGEPVSVAARVSLVFPVLHVSWGAGFWAGLLEAIRPLARR
jgi:glycosyltransferase involved in cell wall biosynthesis